MYWVGKENDGRVGRGGSSAPVCETRWIVPQRPYQAPRGSREAMENAILMGVGAAVIVFGFFIIILSAL